MKIKILKSCSGRDFSYKEGDIVDTNNDIAKDLIGCGFASSVKKTKEDIKTESAEDKAENEDADT